MKKSIISLALGLAAVVGFTSCEEDRDPVYQAPTKFVLNAPAMENTDVVLQPKGVIEFACSQPDYGYAAVTTYSMQMSLTEDFARPYDLTVTPATKAVFTVKQEEVATGLCVLRDADSEETYPGDYDGVVYFRATASLSGVEGSAINSNVVKLNKVKGYFAIPVPGYIYLVGSPEGWAGPTENNAEHYAPWRLFEPKNAIGSKVYSAVFDLPAAPMFRFYTALTGWDADSYGSQADDNPIDCPEYTGGTSSFGMVKGKGAYNFPNLPAGTYTITVDMSDANNMSMTITAGASSVVVTKYIYLVGSLSGWVGPGMANEAAYANYRLADSSDSGIYTGKFACPAGHLNFRFALKLSEEGDGWDNPDQIGIAPNDGDVACEFNNGLFTGTYVPGKGNWAFEIAEDCQIDLTVDTNNNTVTYKIVE